MVEDRRKRGRLSSKEKAGEGTPENGIADNGTADNGTAEVSGYEQFRDKRIRENKERMQKLGILDLSLKLKSKAAPPKRPQREPSDKAKTQNPIPISGSPRRSSRLKTLAPVSYVDKRPKGKREYSQGVEIYMKEGSKPEIYTEEHEKLLGYSVTSWTLSVDGHGEDGKRIYDGVNGETCHQCRQKTLGQHTHCSKCDLVQGQLCGDCLYMRYGENVIEANQNPDWICLVCRGICNCSLCRQAKGWEPTGNLYRKVLKLGYKSVAHYLILTRRSQINSETSVAEVVDLTDVGYPDAASAVAGDAVDGEAKEKPRRSTRVSRN